MMNYGWDLSSLLSLFTTWGPELILVFIWIFPSVNCLGLPWTPFPISLWRVTGLELLDSPLWADNDFFTDFLSSWIDKVASTQGKFSLLDDPQVELLLLRSCLSSYKIIHLLHTVPFSVLRPFLLTLVFKNMLVWWFYQTLLAQVVAT